jgi:2',3'-cyclic-nucleotide 2'-phosphodiesterase
VQAQWVGIGLSAANPKGSRFRALGEDWLRILFFGDVVGKPGREVLLRRLQPLRREHRADLVIVNGENAAAGAGITPLICQEMFAAGVDLITLGNHTWDKREIATYIDEESRLLRPVNYPAGTPGMGSCTVTVGDRKVAVVSLHGRLFFPIFLDDPFRAIDAELERLSGERAIILVDFHGEATSEKVAMGWYLAGRVSAVIGTHTHVQTADEVILPGGTAFISDVGMCGPWKSVIGMATELSLERFTTQMPVRLEVAKGPTILSAVLVEVDDRTGRATAIHRILEREE